MEAINKIKSRVIPLFIDNIDTDQIIPARFLKQTDRSGFGKNLFRDWRFNADGTVKETFPLNQSKYDGKVLITGDNFGCGSSREHAAWALHDFGFRAVISTSFADIFKNNALNNGLLPIEVSIAFFNTLKGEVEKNELFEVEIDLEHQVIKGASQETQFEVNPFKKMCLLKGQNEFGFLLELKEEIEEFENEKEAV